MKDIPNIMSIRELIDTAFGDTRLNIVNHKLIQTILVILAKQLRLLERRVEVELGPTLELPSATSLSVTEIKIHANEPRKKDKGPSATELIATGSKGAKKSLGRHEKTPMPSSAKVSLEASKVLYDKTSLATKSTTNKSTSDKTSTEDQTLTEEKTSTEDETGSDKINSEKTGSNKTSSVKRNLTPETTKTSLKKSSSTLESTIGSSSVDKTRSGKNKSATDHSSVNTTSTETSKSFSEPSSIDKPSKEKLKNKSKISSTEKTLTEISSTGILPTGSKQGLLEDYQKLLESIELKRERELRIIRQRTDSREERNRTPTPMASMDSIEKKYEKLLIVERVPTDGKKGAESTSGSQTGLHEKKTPTLAIVTQDEFEKLTKTVCKLQEKFKTVGVPGFPENAQLLNDLRKGASLTDAMSVLQLSARVEAAEKALEKMMSLVTDLAGNSTEINIEELIAKCQRTYGDDTEEKFEDIYGETVAQFPLAFMKRKSILVKERIAPKFTSNESLQALSTLKAPSEMQVNAESAQQAPPLEEFKENLDTVTYKELDIALQELYDDCVKMVITSTNRSNANANNALKIVNRLEETMGISSDLGGRTSDLEKSVSKYAEQINALDAELSSQMSVYQEQLTQMQHNLELGLETMAEALTNTGGGTAAIADLNQNFRNLQAEIDTCASKQNELRDMQDVLSMGLQSLWKEIEILRATKSDRDEVDDALRDKAGLGDLNGLVSREEFDAVRGDLEKRIGLAYEKFDVEEIIWQKSIDELIKELNDKADWIQVVSLQDSINQYLNKLRAKIRAMEEVVGEPNAAAITRKLHRGADCLSCGTAAHMNLEEPNTIPSLPAFLATRPPAVGAESESNSKPKEDGDHGGLCYPGLPIPHTIDPRSHACHRYCGGSHTLINNTLSRAPAGMIVKPALRQVNTVVGTDGKPYMVDDEKVKEPCIPCNYVKTTRHISEDEPVFSYEDFSSNMTSFDLRQTSIPQQSQQATPQMKSDASDI